MQKLANHCGRWDLGVITTSDLKSFSQCTKSAATARKVIAMVRRTFKNLDIEDFRLLSKTYIRPHLEFCFQAWSPHFVKDITILENVQKVETHLVPRLWKYSYLVRLQMTGITSLEIEELEETWSKFINYWRERENWLQTVFQLHKRTIQPQRTREETGKRQIKIRHKEILLQSKSGQWMEWSSGGSDKLNIGQQFQECLRPLLLQRYGQQKLISCQSINLQVQLQVWRHVCLAKVGVSYSKR